MRNVSQVPKGTLSQLRRKFRRRLACGGAILFCIPFLPSITSVIQAQIQRNGVVENDTSALSSSRTIAGETVSDESLNQAMNSPTVGDPAAEIAQQDSMNLFEEANSASNRDVEEDAQLAREAFAPELAYANVGTNANGLESFQQENIETSDDTGSFSPVVEE